jgi:hypothetical protein
MTNPKTIDRRDVSHATNPIGGHDHIGEVADTSLGEPLTPKSAEFPIGGNGAAVTGMPRGARNEQPNSGTPRNVPPAPSGKSADEARPVAPAKSNPGRLDQVSADGHKIAHVQSPRPMI